MSEKTFLVEIGTEELPPKALRSLAESFAANVTAELDNAGLAHGKIEWFAAPRRLALKVANLAASQPDREVEKRGPAIAQAFDAEGKPSKAAEGSSNLSAKATALATSDFGNSSPAKRGIYCSFNAIATSSSSPS